MRCTADQFAGDQPDLADTLVKSGCTGIDKGIAEAVLEKSETDDTRLCQVCCKSFNGIKAGLSKQRSKTKVLFVHGVNDQNPGCTTAFS